jgi:aubergine-like protein
MPRPFTAALKNFHEINGVLPQKIFIYRDGVGDGQVDIVFNTELTQIWKAFKEIGVQYK